MSTICTFGSCESCGLTQYMQGSCRDCGGKVYQGGKKAFDENQVNNRKMGLVQFVNEHPVKLDESVSRADFESMAAIVYPGALSAGRHPIHGTYINNNLEKRWKGWKACDEFRAGIVPTRQRGKS